MSLKSGISFLVMLYTVFFTLPVFANPLGDLNNSDSVDLQDVILSLQVTGGDNPPGINPDWKDVNSGQEETKQIGMEETIYALWVTAGLVSPGCEYVIYPAEETFPSCGGTGNISVTAQGGCIWTAAESLDWITITAGADGNGDGTVSYTVSENTGTNSRPGTITVAGESFPIMQNGTQSSNYSHPIPDTGQTKCYDTDANEISCAGTGQDGEYTIHPMSYTKLDASGNTLPDTATSWTMVKDNVTGLIWEVKQNQDGTKNYTNPHDADNTYTWYDPDSNTNGGDEGTPGDGTDTKDFVDALNTENYGGYSDWRVPTREELFSIMDYGRYYPSIDTEYFPHTFASGYWSSSSFANDPGDAWNVHFNYGYDSYYSKSNGRSVRAVRGGQARSFDNWVIHGDSTVTDPQTGLMWEAKTDDDGARDKDNEYTWQEALDYCSNLTLAGHSDWRLPTIKELASLADLSRYNPAINTTYFPNTVVAFGSYYWSSSSYANDPGDAWYVYFFYGNDNYDNKPNPRYVRAVRNVQ